MNGLQKHPLGLANPLLLLSYLAPCTCLWRTPYVLKRWLFTSKVHILITCNRSDYFVASIALLIGIAYDPQGFYYIQGYHQWRQLHTCLKSLKTIFSYNP